MRTRYKILTFLFIVAVTVSLPFNAGAWGIVGHKLTAKIAYTQLTPAIKDSLKVYLGDMTIEEASVWMDEIRSDPSNDSLRPYHYINMEKGEHYHPDSTHNIIGALDRVIRELKERHKYDKEHIAVDLKILIHLVGDLHQPMHNGYGSDRGGNSVSVFVAGGGSNLHRAWDTDLLESYILNESMDWITTGSYTKEQLAEIRKVNVLDWMHESRGYLEECYDFKNQSLDRKYVKRAVPIVKERILFGGIRLGKLLRDIFHS